MGLRLKKKEKVGRQKKENKIENKGKEKVYSECNLHARKGLCFFGPRYGR